MPVAAATRLALRGETALAGAAVALIISATTLHRLGPPGPVMPEAAWVRLNEGAVRTAVIAAAAALGLSILALLLPRQRRVVPIGLAVIWAIALVRAFSAEASTIGAIARVLRDHGTG